MKQNVNFLFRRQHFGSSIKRQLVYFFSIVIMLLPQIANAITISGSTTVCQGDNATYTVPASTDNVYVWSVDPKGKVLSSGTLGSTSEANISWKKDGTAVITLTILKKIDGSTVATETLNVTVLPRPNPVITWDVEVGCQILIEGEVPQDPAEVEIDLTKCIKVCESSTVNYSVPVVSGSTYTWSVAGGTATPSGATCNVVWGAAGAGSIEVTETSAGGCVGKKFMCIEIVKKPTALFDIMSDPGAGPVDVCVFEDVVFKDRSSANGGTALISWFWDFGDGATSGDANPTHTYTAAGTYLVKLKVKNECNCTSEYEIEIIVSALAGVKIICPGVVCENATVKYSVVDACTTYDWSVIGGSILSTMPYGKEIEIKWDFVDDKGIGYVLFDAAACSVDCPSKTVIKVPVMKTSGVIEGKPIICTNKQYRYKLPRYPATVYTWSIVAGATGAVIIHTDQTNEVVIEGPTAGTVTLNCTYTNTLLTGCVGTASMNIQLENPPTIDGEALFCEGGTESYTLSTSAAADWTLRGPGGTVTYSGVTFSNTFTTPGTYRLSAEGTFCWPEPLEIIVDALPPVPISIDGPSELCPGSPGNFTAKSGEAKSVFIWSATGGGTFNVSSGSHTTFTPSGSGPWVISVLSRNKKAPMCESAAITKTITAPVVGSIVITGEDEPCAESYFSYHETYTSGYDYKWTIVPEGAGSVTAGGDGPDPTILWNTTTSIRYATIYVEFKQCGITYDTTFDVAIQPIVIPTIDFLDDYCAGALVDPSVLGGTDLKGGTLTVDDWGDGTTGGATHIYSNSGSYTIKGRIIGPGGCDDDVPFERTIKVHPKPSVSIGGAGAYCFPYTSSITLTASGIGTGITYSWGIGGTLLVPPVLPIGDHPYSVTVTDANLCTNTTTAIISIVDCSSGPPTPPCVPSGSTSIGGLILDANCNGEVNIGYTLGGFFTGSHSLSKKDVTPDHAADGGFISTTLSEFQFTVDKTIVGIHRFDYTSTYWDASFAPCTKSQEIQVIVPLYVNFDWSITCGSGSTYDVTFKSQSIAYEPVAGSGPHTYTWTVDKVGTGIVYGPTTGTATLGALSLDAGASYDITLTEGTSGGFTCSSVRRLDLPNKPVASYTVDFTPVCEGVPVNFNSTSTPTTGLRNDWDFGDFEHNSKNQRTYTYQSGVPSDMWPSKLTVYDKYGCSDVSSTTNVNVFENQLEGDVTASPTLVCPDDAVSLNFIKASGSDNPNTLVWMHDNTALGVTTYPTGFSVTAPQSGTYFAILNGDYGCKANASGTYVTVVNVPDPIIVGKPDVCVNEEFTLNAFAGDDIHDYSWEMNDGSGWVSVSAAAPYYDLVQNISTPGTYKYRVTITVEKTASPLTLCSSISEEYIVEVHGLPTTPTIGYTMLDCASYEMSLTATSPDAGTYTWSNGLSGSPITVFAGGPYKVTLTDAYGCASSAQEFILKDPKDYLWVFPVGCYNLCPSPSFILNGPAIRFSYWAWLRNSTTVISGSFSKVAPYSLVTSGLYNLHLDNGLCAATSGDLNFNALGCVDSSCGQAISVIVDSVSYSNPSCRATLHTTITNVGAPVISYTITPSMGGYVNIIGAAPILTPTIPVPLVFEWVAPATGYPSGSVVEFVITVKYASGATCNYKIVQTLTCPYGHVLYRIGDTSSTVIKSSSISSLSIAPNPAKDRTVVRYGFDSNRPQGDKNLVVYDMVGRRLGSYPLYKEQGELELHFGNWTSGIYRLVLLQGGQVVKTIPLSISR